WSLAYIERAASGAFVNIQADEVGELFTRLQENPGLILFWHTLAMVLTTWVVARGVNRGIERATSLMVPLLVAMLLILTVYNFTTPGFNQALDFMFTPDFSQVTGQTVLVALGHAFFTLSLGMGAIMAYGSYLPEKTSLAQVAGWILLLDTGIALLAGLVIFPIVYSHGLNPGEGAGLVFITLPLAVGALDWAYFLSVLLFVMISIAAWTSAISLLEPATAYIQQRFGIARARGAIMIGVTIWALGVLSALSFNLLSDVSLFGQSIFNFKDFLSSNIMLPLGGMLISLFAVWKLSRSESEGDLGLTAGAYRLWRVLAGIIAPLSVALILIAGLGLFGLKL
ncbi:MAG TPA: sodium-dependent transporter, partial [Halothiobacillaceae bacterium]|nr:sodium-dependent transporter [Halothiobacillaceae bacterium]